MKHRLPALRALVLAAVLVGCTGSEEQPEREPHVITGGGTTGVYYEYGRHLAAAMTDELDSPVVVAESNGSVENLERVASGAALFGFAQGDTAVDAVGGRAPFDGPMPIQAVARLYDEFVHVVVPANSTIEELGDLRDRAVSLGASGSGSEVVARRVLRAAAVEPGELNNASLGIDASIEAMLRGDLDAFVWVGGLPTPGVSSLADQMPIRLIPVDEEVDAINADHDGAYRHAVVPQGVYGVTEIVSTMAVPTYLLTSADTPDDVVYDALRVVFGERLVIARNVPAAGRLDRRWAIFTEPVELHDGAMLYFRESKA